MCHVLSQSPMLPKSLAPKVTWSQSPMLQSQLPQSVLLPKSHAPKVIFSQSHILPKSHAPKVTVLCNCMPCLNWDKMTVLWPNEYSILSFHSILFIRIPNVSTFLREVFWLNGRFRLWRNDCFVTKWMHYFVFYFILYIRIPNATIFVRPNEWAFLLFY